MCVEERRQIWTQKYILTVRLQVVSSQAPSGLQALIIILGATVQKIRTLYHASPEHCFLLISEENICSPVDPVPLQPFSSLKNI